MAYRGKFFPTNQQKYEGNPREIVYRSLWERQVFKWCDENPDVISWSSEEVVVPYICKTDGKWHRYYVDLKIKFPNKTILVEIKPKKETKPPVNNSNKKSPRYLTECLKYAKNHSKWVAAIEFAKNRNWTFTIWTEDTLESLGIKLISPAAARKKRKTLNGRHKK